MPRGVYRNARTRPNLIRRRYERLTVIAFVGLDARGNYLWRCRCACGDELTVLGYNLKRGFTRSCGCLRQEVSRARAIRPLPRA